MNYSEGDEREAHIDNMRADTQYKLDLSKYEPWKIVIAAFGAGAGVVLALLAIATLILAHLR